MKEFQKTQGQVHPKTTKATIPPPTPPKKEPLIGDGLFTLIFIAVGTLGLYHVGSTYEQPSVYNTNISPSSQKNSFGFNYSVGTPSSVNLQQGTKIKKAYSNQLLINGKPEVTKHLTLTIDSYDKNVSYTIDLGNGDVLEPRAKTVNYEYPVSGTYLVELIATYKGQETILYSDFIDIYNSVELVSAVDVGF